MSFTAVDLTRLPAPDVVERVDYEAILSALKAKLIALMPELEATLALESEPLTKILETVAAREVMLRQRVNDAARSVMLAFASGADLEHLAALYGVQRETLKPGDPEAIPPLAPSLEDDASLRRRAQLAPEAIATAGSEGAYKFHGLCAGESPTQVAIESPQEGLVTVSYRFERASFAAKVKDISVQNTAPGEVLLTVLSREDDGVADDTLVAAVRAQCSSAYVRPLTDKVSVQAAKIKDYQVKAKLVLESGPDEEVILNEARKRLEIYVKEQHGLGKSIALSGLDAALHIGGVIEVTITSPAATIESDFNTAPYCRAISLEVANA